MTKAQIRKAWKIAGLLDKAFEAWDALSDEDRGQIASAAFQDVGGVPDFQVVRGLAESLSQAASEAEEVRS